MKIEFIYKNVSKYFYSTIIPLLATISHLKTIIIHYFHFDILTRNVYITSLRKYNIAGENRFNMRGGKRNYRKCRINNSAVSEVLGTVLILAISVVILTSVYIAAFTLPPPNIAPVVNIVGMTANDKDIILSHQGGDDVSLDSTLILTIGGKDIKFKIENLLDVESAADGYWNIGEQLVFSHDIRQLEVQVKIIDSKSNSVIMMGILQEGLLLRDPYAITLNATDITAISAKLNMKHNFWKESGSVRFAYRVTAGTWIYTPWVAMSGEDDYGLIINGLNYNTNYEYKAQLTWGSNSTEGAIKHFTTIIPTILTLDATDVRTRTAKLWMEYDFKGLSGMISFSYKPNGGSWIDTPWVAASGQGTYSEIVNNLIPKSIYEFKARIQYDVVTDDGNIKSFTTWSIIMGWWHFSEGSGTTAYDSSGLDNHGIIYDADWTTGVNTTALSFDGIDDYLRVYDSSSLDITTQLTVEAWIKPLEKSEGYIGDITDIIIDSTWFGPNYGHDSDIIQISADIFAISFRGDADDGYLVTFTLVSDGTIKNVIDYLEFDNYYCYEPDIIHIINDIYAVVYEGPDYDGFVKTIRISSDGQINDVVIDTIEFDTSNGEDPDIINVNGDIYAIVYVGPNGDGYAKTIEIKVTGDITDTVIDTTIFFDTESGTQISEPKIIYIDNNNYAIVFRNPDDDGEVRTITILNDGTFTSASKSDGEYIGKFVHDGYDGWTPSITLNHVNGNILASCYRGRDGKGALVTMNIASSGDIQQDVIDKFYFDPNECYEPRIIYLSGNYYVIVYRGVNNDGFAVIVEIDGNGQITDSVLYTLEFDTTDCYKPTIIHYNGDTFIIAYTNNNEGYVKTVNVTSIPDIYELHVSRYTIFDFIEPDIINVFDDVYAIVSQGLNADGYLRTFQIQNNGVISDSVIDVLEYDLINGCDNVITDINGNIFAIIYRGPNNHGYIKTVEITNGGDIKDDDIIDTLEFDSSNGYEPNIINIDGNIYAIAYRGPGNHGFVKTVEISNLGQITDTVIDSLEFETSYCYEPNIIHIAGNIYAIAYRGPDDDGYIKTVAILDNGDITDTVVDYYEYDTSNGFKPEIINVTNNLFAIIHSYQYMGGYISTIEIADDGTITKNVLDTFRFDNKQPGGDDDAYDPHIIHIDDWIFAVVYRGEYNAYLKTLRIGNSGDISDINDDYLLYDSNGYEPRIIHVDGNIYAISFSGSGSNAEIKTVEIIPINATWPRTVVYKQNAYGLQSDGISIFGYINSNTITAPLSSDFNYVVLTFNSSLSSYQMKLYVDSVLINEINVSGSINVNGNNLIMGDDYNGIIDEVTIWNIALSDAQILTNYNLFKP